MCGLELVGGWGLGPDKVQLLEEEGAGSSLAVAPFEVDRGILSHSLCLVCASAAKLECLVSLGRWICIQG